MKLFIYNEKSILNNPVSRWINFIIMSILTLLFICNEATPPTITYWGLAFIIMFSSICMSFCYDITMQKTKFYDDGTGERNKQNEFSIRYIMVSSMLSCALAIACAICYQAYFQIGFNRFYCMMSFIPIPILIFNLLNIPSLYYPIFKDVLRIS